MIGHCRSRSTLQLFRRRLRHAGPEKWAPIKRRFVLRRKTSERSHLVLGALPMVSSVVSKTSRCPAFLGDLCKAGRVMTVPKNGYRGYAI